MILLKTSFVKTTYLTDEFNNHSVYSISDMKKTVLVKDQDDIYGRDDPWHMSPYIATYGRKFNVINIGRP